MSDQIDTITGLCEISSRCPICFRSQDGSECSGCQAYYPECDCIPLTKEEIVLGETI